MESNGVRLERRGRKRKKDVQNGFIEQQAQRAAVKTRSKAFLGRYLKKEFDGSGVFLGKIVSYDKGLYRVVYEDGDCEDLESSEVRQFAVEETSLDESLMIRKKKFDEILLKKDVKAESVAVTEPINVVETVEESSLSEIGNVVGDGNNEDQVDDDADLSSDLCEYAEDSESSAEVEEPLIPPPELPPSSSNVNVPQEYISHLFSVYGFLRSFSIQLFLSPFGLDDFIGSLNCSVPNTLLDAIHVALMRALRRHFEALSSDGSEFASKCLSCMDWSLLDTLTWPVYLVQYLLIMGYTRGPEWKGFYTDALQRNYYTLPVGRKLMILQILCDECFESQELRAEIDMREESEVGLDSEADALAPLDCAPRRVHPRFSKTSACKDLEAMEIVAENRETKSSYDSSSLGSKVNGLDASVDGDQDANADECRLCGMDGTLLCCDGCPSAYHSRCIGLVKMYMPEGAWYCPECTINKVGPKITKGTSLKGADIFGIDLYQQVFLGTCHHLIVMKVTNNSEPYVRYYNPSDIPRVLQALNTSVPHIPMYFDICKEIVQYWEIPEDVFALSEAVKVAINLANINMADGFFGQSRVHLGLNGPNPPEAVEGKIFPSCPSESNLKGTAIPFMDKQAELKQDLLESVTQPELSAQHSNSDSTMRGSSDTKLMQQIKVEPAMSGGSINQQAGISGLTHQSLAEKSSFLEYTCTSGNNDSIRVAANMTKEHREASDWISGSGYRNLVNDWVYKGSSFKSQAYINHYTNGDFAASAAASLGIMSSEDSQVSESQLDKRRKAMTINASASIQVKAFSSVAVRFFWPHSERKIVEVPRERCGWCLSCRAAVTSKRGCLLNAAASNAIKGAMKIIAGVRPAKLVEGCVLDVATYVMFMEESLCGLTIGPFLSKAYRLQWRKQVEQATTFCAIKPLLLELEKNIRILALSGDWFKLVDSWSMESPVNQVASTSVTGSTQKRGPGRRGRKPLSMPETTGNDCEDKAAEFTWWRGGMLSKLIFQKGSLPCSMVKKAARQGGSVKMPGIYYDEGSEVPKRSRQFAWRAAVEMSKNASQLALQVRFLDLHVRWIDLVRPELSLQDGKGPETEASAFRNAFVCNKKITDNKIRYCVAFGNQKHLPSRVMKSVIEVEQSQGGKDKYWFLETRIPLYLIKEYEENLQKMLSTSTEKPVDVSFKLQRRLLKRSRCSIFSYLMGEDHKMDKHCCASCQQDVLLGNAVKCSACQGYCHELCTISSTVQVNEEVEFLISCKQCYHTKVLAQNENSSNESPTSPLFLQVQNTEMVNRGGQQIIQNQPLAALESSDHSSSGIKSTTDGSNSAKKARSNMSWGLIWKKKQEDNGIDFRLNNILLKGNPDRNLLAPKCHLCHKDYNPDLMYIRCETCKNWYHAEAVELKESKIFDVVGFKCCRCRRIKTPMCPYMDPDAKRLQDGKKPRTRIPKNGNSKIASHSKTISENSEEAKPTAPMIHLKEEIISVQQNDPLLLPLTMVEQYAELSPGSVSGSGPQKLQVRRHLKPENNMDASSANNPSHFESSAFCDGRIMNPAELSQSLHIDWDASVNGYEDNMMFDYETLNYEDMEFEPQTYFSFTELLASDDGEQLDVIGSSGAAVTDWENPSVLSQDGMQSAIDRVPCQRCFQTEPGPDLTCQICGLTIHGHCSPWVEQSSCQDGWRCGKCREWR